MPRLDPFGRVARSATTMLLAAGLAFVSLPASAQGMSLDDMLSAVVRLKTTINPDGRTVKSLGAERDGSGIVIDDSGLILTIGYLMVEASSARVITNDGQTVAANVVAYDHNTGFGLLRAAEPLKVRPMSIGKAADIKERDPVLAASFGGRNGVAPAYVISKREFAAGWEYLLEQAFFTAPAHTDWAGAALISREGKLIGVGALVVADVTGKGDGLAGNMYVPIDILQPILGDLLATGHAPGPPRPWLGLTLQELQGHVFVGRTVLDGPAEKAGLQKGDIIVGVAGEKLKGLADFYRKVWAKGPAGTIITIDLIRDAEPRHIDVPSANRLDFLKLKPPL